MSLGRFIATFAEPSKTGLNYKDGMWINLEGENDDTDDIFQTAQCHQGRCFELLTSEIMCKPKFLEECSFKKLNSTFNHDCDDFSSVQQTFNFKNCQLQFEESEAFEPSRYSSSETFCDTVFISNYKNLVEINNSGSKLSILPNCQKRNFSTKEKQYSGLISPEEFQADNENNFNNFQFWRMPLPDVDLDIEKCKSTNSKTDIEEENSHSCSTEPATTIMPKQNSTYVFFCFVVY